MHFAVSWTARTFCLRTFEEYGCVSGVVWGRQRAANGHVTRWNRRYEDVSHTVNRDAWQTRGMEKVGRTMETMKKGEDEKGRRWGKGEDDEDVVSTGTDKDTDTVMNDRDQLYIKL